MAVGYSPEPKELKFHAVNYDNLDAIKGLIRFYFSLKSDLDYKPNMEVLSILSDIDNAIQNSGLTQKQKKVLALYMEGWTEEEIGVMLSVSQQAVHKHLTAICKRMSNYLGG